jgi:hypothetical protein
MIFSRAVFLLLSTLFFFLNGISAQTLAHAIAINKKFLKMAVYIPDGYYSFHSVSKHAYIKFTSDQNVLSYITLPSPKKIGGGELFKVKDRGANNYTISHLNDSGSDKCLSASWYGADNTIMAYVCNPDYRNKRDEWWLDEDFDSESNSDAIRRSELTPAKQLWIFIPVPKRPKGIYVVMGTVHMFNQWPVCIYADTSALDSDGLALKSCPKNLFSNPNFFWEVVMRR